MLARDGVRIQSGVLSLKRAGTHAGDRYVRFSNWLLQICREYKVNEIFYESVPRFESAGWAIVYGGLLCIVRMTALNLRIRLAGIAPHRLKKEFTGTTRADKTMMCKVAHALGWQGGHPGTDIGHDEADAIAIGYVILKIRGVDLQLTEDIHA